MSLKKCYKFLTLISLLVISHQQSPISDFHYCHNGELDAGETDVDCGGICPHRCAFNQICTKDDPHECGDGLECTCAEGGARFCRCLRSDGQRCAPRTSDTSTPECANVCDKDGYCRSGACTDLPALNSVCLNAGCCFCSRSTAGSSERVCMHRNGTCPSGFTLFCNTGWLDVTVEPQCAPGSVRRGPFKPTQASICSLCPPGMYSSMPDAYECSACEGNTYSEAGFAECRQCLPGTRANADHTGCGDICAKMFGSAASGVKECADIIVDGESNVCARCIDAENACTGGGLCCSALQSELQCNGVPECGWCDESESCVRSSDPCALISFCTKQNNKNDCAYYGDMLSRCTYCSSGLNVTGYAELLYCVPQPSLVRHNPPEAWLEAFTAATCADGLVRPPVVEWSPPPQIVMWNADGSVESIEAATVHRQFDLRIRWKHNVMVRFDVSTDDGGALPDPPDEGILHVPALHFQADGVNSIDHHLVGVEWYDETTNSVLVVGEDDVWTMFIDEVGELDGESEYHIGVLAIVVRISVEPSDWEGLLSVTFMNSDDFLSDRFGNAYMEVPPRAHYRVVSSCDSLTKAPPSLLTERTELSCADFGSHSNDEAARLGGCHWCGDECGSASAGCVLGQPRGFIEEALRNRVADECFLVPSIAPAQIRTRLTSLRGVYAGSLSFYRNFPGDGPCGSELETIAVQVAVSYCGIHVEDWAEKNGVHMRTPIIESLLWNTWTFVDPFVLWDANAMRGTFVLEHDGAITCIYLELVDDVLYIHVYVPEPNEPDLAALPDMPAMPDLPDEPTPLPSLPMGGKGNGNVTAQRRKRATCDKASAVEACNLFPVEKPTDDVVCLEGSGRTLHSTVKLVAECSWPAMGCGVNFELPDDSGTPTATEHPIDLENVCAGTVGESAVCVNDGVIDMIQHCHGGEPFDPPSPCYMGTCVSKPTFDCEIRPLQPLTFDHGAPVTVIHLPVTDVSSVTIVENPLLGAIYQYDAIILNILADLLTLPAMKRVPAPMTLLPSLLPLEDGDTVSDRLGRLFYVPVSEFRMGATAAVQSDSFVISVAPSSTRDPDGHSITVRLTFDSSAVPDTWPAIFAADLDDMMTSPVRPSKEPANTPLYIGIAVLVVVALIAVVGAILFLRRRKAQRDDAPIDDEENRPGTNTNDVALNETKSASRRVSDASTAVSVSQKFTIAKREVKKLEVVGTGSFGKVYRAEWRDITVAVKEIGGMADDEARRQLISEAQGMQSMRPHKNVVTLYGIVTEPLSIVTEFCEKGSLDDLLYCEKLSKRCDFTELEMRSIVLGIARGVAHLHAEKIIHRDLAARNILVDVGLVAKVADFGMARTDKEAANQTAQKFGPVKWMAPEQLANYEYSTQSDVWSFGVILWECYERRLPWSGLNNLKVAQQVLNGETLKVPVAAPEVVASVMKQCWQFDSTDRPTMVALLRQLQTAWGRNGNGEPVRRLSKRQKSRSRSRRRVVPGSDADGGPLYDLPTNYESAPSEHGSGVSNAATYNSVYSDAPPARSHASQSSAETSTYSIPPPPVSSHGSGANVPSPRSPGRDNIHVYKKTTHGVRAGSRSVSRANSKVTRRGASTRRAVRKAPKDST